MMNESDELVDRRGLMKFVSPNVGSIRVLVIESLSYLRELRQLLPSAHISVLTQYRTNALEFDELELDWIFGDFKKCDFPFDENTFDIIVAEDALTFAYEPYQTLFNVNRQLKDTGFLVTEFENVRFINVLESLRQGYFPVRERRMYAKTEVVRLLNDALFKEISFAPDEIINANISDWIKFGFDNYNDELKVKTWIVKACRSTAEVAALKQFFTPAIRKELSTILHRIEYDIDRDDNIKRLFNLCKQHYIFDDYLMDFIEQVVVHRDVFKNIMIAKNESLTK